MPGSNCLRQTFENLHHLYKFFKGNIPLELKKVLLKAFQEVGLKPNEKLNLDTSDLDKTKNKKIERSNYFER